MKNNPIRLAAILIAACTTHVSIGNDVYQQYLLIAQDKQITQSQREKEM